MDHAPDPMTIDEAVMHLHNLAHMFFAPALVAEAAKVAQDGIHRHEALMQELDSLRTTHDTLAVQYAQLQVDAAQLQHHVDALTRQRTAVQAALDTAATSILAQVKGIPRNGE